MEKQIEKNNQKIKKDRHLIKENIRLKKQIKQRRKSIFRLLPELKDPSKAPQNLPPPLPRRRKKLPKPPKKIRK